MYPSDLDMKPTLLGLTTLLLLAFTAASSSADLRRRQFAAILDGDSRVSTVNAEFLCLLMIHIKSQYGEVLLFFGIL